MYDKNSVITIDMAALRLAWRLFLSRWQMNNKISWFYRTTKIFLWHTTDR